MPVGVWSKVQICGCFIADNVSSSPSEAIDFRLLCLLCRYRLVGRADHSFRGVLQCVCVCVCVCAFVIQKRQQRGGRDPSWAVAPQKKNYTIFSSYLFQ